jgi:sensor histidine kinase YesM
MLWPFHHKEETRYWLKVFALYALVEACVQLLFMFILNNFGNRRISIPEFHLVMWVFQCLLIWPIWWVARALIKQKIIIQVFVSIVFYVVYSYCWFGPVQDAIASLYNGLQHITRPVNDQQVAILDDGKQYSYLNYQLLKHAFRLSWFYMANYFWNYYREEKKRIELAVSNKELQLKLLKWHLNPSFYFKTIKHLQQSAAVNPSDATEPILQLAKVMEYVIYEAREPKIEMKKEIQFLGNYIELINQQPDNKAFISLEYKNGYEKLRIAPLLLAGLVDNIVTTPANDKKKEYSISLQFLEDEMFFSVAGAAVKPVIPPLFEELYPGKFVTNFSPEKKFELRIQLDEA